MDCPRAGKIANDVGKAGMTDRTDEAVILLIRLIEFGVNSRRSRYRRADLVIIDVQIGGSGHRARSSPDNGCSVRL